MEPGNNEHPRDLSHRIAATTSCRCTLDDSMHSHPLLIVRPQPLGPLASQPSSLAGLRARLNTPMHDAVVEA